MTSSNRPEIDDFDDELTSLFSAFDDVRASDELKESTLASILSSADRESGEEEPSAHIIAFEQERKAAKDRPRRNAKFKVFRIIAIAACLAMALTGGAAYALPASHMKLSQGDEAIELDINCFGTTISAAAESSGDEPIQTEGLTNRPYEESIAEAASILDRRNGAEPIDVNVEAGDPGRRQQMEDRGAEIIAERTSEDFPVEGAPDESAPPSGETSPQQGEPQSPRENPQWNGEPGNGWEPNADTDTGTQGPNSDAAAPGGPDAQGVQQPSPGAGAPMDRPA